MTSTITSTSDDYEHEHDYEHEDEHEHEHDYEHEHVCWLVGLSGDAGRIWGRPSGPQLGPLQRALLEHLGVGFRAGAGRVARAEL